MKKREIIQAKLLRLLQQYRRVSVSDAVSALNLSEATIRRYFADLESAGKLLRVHGGVCRVSSKETGDYLFQREAFNNVAAKQAIGQAAASLLGDHERLFFDSGTTVSECGIALGERLKSGEISDVSIVTNSLLFSDVLASSCSLTMTGGSIRPSRKDLFGIVALENIERYNFTKAILGADGISKDGVLTTTDEETSILATAAIRHSQSVIILADSSKLDRLSFSSYGKLEGKRFTLVTDTLGSPEILESLAELGINLITVKVPSHIGK